MNLEIHNKVAQLSIKCFNNLPKTGKPTSNEWTILSCIIKQNTVANSFEVVSIGTGTKCIGKQKMSPVGDILNDSHAEVICRRTFLRYLYDEINSEISEIFTYNNKSGKYCLHDFITFHFYASQIPCGDAAVFVKQDHAEGREITCTPLKRPCSTNPYENIKRLKCDFDESSELYQTATKCLSLDKQSLKCEVVGVVRLKPGKGDPTLSVSCSDKIAKWCYLGLQGALLSLLVEKPIYLDTFTIAGGTPFCEKAMLRSLYERFAMLDTKQKRMQLAQVTEGFEFYKTDSKQPCSSSIAWCKANSGNLEISVDGKKQGITKKNRNSKASRLKISKIELFRAFLSIVKKKQLNIFQPEIKLETIKYCDAKSKATTYQKAWMFLKTNGFKEWTIKDEQLLQFCID